MTNGIAKMKPKYDTHRVARAAIKIGLNAHTLAKRAGVNHATTGKIFRGGQVTGTTLRKIVAVLPDLEISDITVPLPEAEVKIQQPTRSER